jgi:hypothetical protein
MKRLLATLVVLAVALPAAAQAAPPAAPAWAIEATPYPSNFEPGSAYDSTEGGPAYLVQVFNVGGAATSGAFTITDTLPKGMLPAGGFPPHGVYGRENEGETPTLPLSCSAQGRRVTCVGGTAGPLGPGEAASIVLPVEVEATAGTLVNKAQVEGGGAPVAEAAQPTSISAGASAFGFLPGSPDGFTTEADGSVTSRAGSHPYQMTVAGINLTTNQNAPGVEDLLASGGGLREARVELPKGVVINPQAATQCKEAELVNSECPAASQVGTFGIAVSIARGFGQAMSLRPLYNMVPPAGYPAELGFQVVQGSYEHLLGGVKSDGTFTLTAASRDILAKYAIGNVRTTLWGIPSDASHDAQRGRCMLMPLLGGCPVERDAKPFLTMPSACSGPLTTTVGVASWDEPDQFVNGSYPSTDLEGDPVGVEGCSSLGFEPQISAAATTDKGDSPSGLEFHLHQPQAIVSDPDQGTDLVCAPGQWEGALFTYAYGWLRDGAPIAGADSHVYEVRSEDAGHSIQCEVSATSKEAGPAVSTSAPLQIPPGPAIEVPTASLPPSAHVTSQTLTITGSKGEYILSYREKNTPPIPFDAGAAEVQEALEQAESIGPGKVTVSGAASPFTIGFTGALAGVEPNLSVLPTEEEQAQKEAAPAALSSLLACEPGAWSGSPTFAFQWLKKGVPIAGEEGSSYAAPSGTVTGSIQCEVSASNASGRTVAISAAADPRVSIPPSIGPDEGGVPPATANLKDATVTLPAGMAVNPSAANGLDACSSAQIGLSSPIGQTPVRFAEQPASCPNAAKVGTAEVKTPLLGKTLDGSVYLARPFDNPFDSLLALYLVIEDEQTGIIAKLAGHVEPDPGTGQLTATFAENPELPLEDVKLNIFGGPGGTLTTPIACGEHVTTTTLVPWSAPEGADAHPSASFQTSGACSSSEATAPKAFSFSAGTTDPLAGAYSPFVMKLTRADGSQHLKSLDLSLPPGLTGRLTGVPYCSNAQIAQAEARSHPEEGRIERQNPSCPAASEVGSVDVSAGSGPSPVSVSGRAYLSGPYKGAPLSLAIITPAVTGPFDLGVVVVRVALEVNLESAQITAKSDPLPTILDGIPLDIRSVAVNLGRPQFSLNPTNCEAMSIGAVVGTAAGQGASLSNHFQVGSCEELKFKPKLKVTLKGSAKHGYPALKAVVTYPQAGAYANIARAQVNLPHSVFLEQNNLNKTCTKPVLLEGKCPAKTIYGTAKAWTPLLEKPLEGPVYLVGGFGYKLPALVAELNGQIRVLLKGKVDSGPNHGIRNTFEAVPDAPVSRFVLQMKGGKKYGLLINSENLCAKPQHVIARFTGQNGAVEQSRPLIARNCKGGHKSKKRRPKKH